MMNKRGMQLQLNLNLPLLLKHYLCVSQSVLPDEEEEEQQQCETISDVNVTDQSEHYEEEEEEQQEEKAEADQYEQQEHGAATKEEAERRVTLMGMGSCNSAVEVDVYTVRTTEMLLSLSLSATDEHGDVAFTVPRPSSSNSIDTPIFLVDSQGSPLFTMFSRPLALGLAGYRWDAYPGDVGADLGRCHYRDKQHHSLPLPLFHAWSRGNRTTCVVMNSNFYSPKNSSNNGGGGGREAGQHNYSVEGSYADRNCIIYKAPRIVVAEIKRKCANWKVMLGKDVYNVVIRRQGTDASFIMALVAILHHMSPRHSNSS